MMSVLTDDFRGLPEALKLTSAVYLAMTLSFQKKLKLFMCFCGLVVRVPGCTTEMYCASCEVQTEFIYVMWKKVDRLCSQVVRVPGYTTEMYCASCEVQTKFVYVM
jgi:hypothetical protein